MITVKFEYALKSAERPKPTVVFKSTEVDRNTPWRKVSAETHMVQQQRQMPSGKNKLERDFQTSKETLNKTQRKIDNELDDRFG